MTWLKEIVPILITKLKSWQTFVLCLIAVSGYISIQFYKAKTERIVAVAQVPSAKPDGFVESKLETNYAGIVQKSKPEAKSEK